MKDVWDTENAAAWGKFEDTLFDIGFGKLYIHTNPKLDDAIQMHAAGLLEGALVAPHIWNHKHNVFEFETSHYLNTTDFAPEIYDFVERTRLFLVENIEKYKATDPYWAQMSFIYAQFEGLVEGYNLVTADPARKLNTQNMWMYESIGDLLDLYHANLTAQMSLHERVAFWQTATHCSGLVKLLPQNKELYISQAAWFFFGSMNRVLKHYDIPLNHPSTATKQLTMSSYPGLLYSFDDFYVLGSGLAVIETTIGNYNDSLYANIQSRSILEWVRVMVANRMGHSGEEWTATFGRYNSGSYNNQYLVVDYSKFTPGKEPLPGTLWILEQYPGGYFAKDRTDVLKSQLYYPSFNVPSLDETYDMLNFTGAADVDAHTAFWEDRETSCRAQQFRREHTSVTDLESMRAIMRFNNWQKDNASVDPVFGRDPGAAIASRYDLRRPPLPKGLCFGEIDTKITSSNMASHMTFTAISGPTTHHDEALPVFDFTTAYYAVPHAGLPDRWDFGWVLFHPETPAIGTVFVVMLVLAGIVIAGLATFAVVLGVRKYRHSRAAAYQPLPDPSSQDGHSIQSA
eukprot:GAFH01001067.1.p1 GENE.GAFH01001067.1~~GAFH01001067.1.p1  ORF type:complete len:607 (+),score=260.42 GAFH01001067.1:112-1821(+)